MRTIIAGSRPPKDQFIKGWKVESWHEQKMRNLKEAVAYAPWIISEIVSGTARGIDELGERYAKEKGIPVKLFKPDWSMGKRAGPLRNLDMAKYAQALIAVWDGTSPGTAHMIRAAKSMDMPIVIHSPLGIQVFNAERVDPVDLIIELT